MKINLYFYAALLFWILLQLPTWTFYENVNIDSICKKWKGKKDCRPLERWKLLLHFGILFICVIFIFPSFLNYLFNYLFIVPIISCNCCCKIEKSGHCSSLPRLPPRGYGTWDWTFQALSLRHRRSMTSQQSLNISGGLPAQFTHLTRLHVLPMTGAPPLVFLLHDYLTQRQVWPLTSARAL